MHLLPNVFRTEGDMVDFDPSKIYDSVLKETGMSEKDAKHITELVVRRIISSGIKFLSGPHIREIVCSILSEQHFERERKIYTRIGMPLMDYEDMIESNLEAINPEKIHHLAANKISSEYALLRILNDEEMKAHLYGDIYIHKLEYFDLRPYSQYWDPRVVLKHGIPPDSIWTHCSKSGPAGNLRVAVNHLSKWIGMMQGEFSEHQGYTFITNFLAPYARRLSDDEIKQGMQSLVFEINQISAIIGRDIPITSLSCCPAIIDLLSKIPAVGPYGKTEGTYGDFQEEGLKLFEALTEIYANGDYNKKAFQFPKHFVYFNQNWLIKYEKAYAKIWDEIKKMQTPYLVNLCSEWQTKKIKDAFLNNKYFSNGILQTISINFPRLAYASNNESKFIDSLREVTKLCSGILLKKYDIVKKRLSSKHLPICSSIIEGEPIYNLKNQALALGFVGLNEAVKHLTNYELHENSSAFEFGIKIITEMKELCEEMSKNYDIKYILLENQSDIEKARFATLDLKHFPKIAFSQMNERGKYYTKSSRFRERLTMDIFERVSKQGEFHSLIQNDIFENISLKELEKIIEVKDLINKICVASKIGCLKFDL